MSSKILEIRIANLKEWGKKGYNYTIFTEFDVQKTCIEMLNISYYPGYYVANVQRIIGMHSENSFKPSYIRINYEK